VELFNYNVGERIPKFATSDDRVIFDLTDGGAYLFVCMNKPSQKEADSFKSDNPFEIRMIKLHNVLFLLFKFGPLKWMDAPYNPHLSLNLTSLQTPEETQGYALTIYLIDSAIGEIQSMRFVGLGHDFSMKIKSEVEDCLKMPFSKAIYDDTLEKLFTSYTTKQLVSMSTESFKIKQK